MKIGIYTYGTRGDLQPYIAMALELISRGNDVIISATEDFKDLVESYQIPFIPLWGNAEMMMNSEEGRSILKTENSIKLMKYYFKVIHNNRDELRKSYINSISKVDFLIVNSMTLPITSAIAEQQNKKMALTYFMPPVVPTAEFPISDFDFLNFKWYNKLTYKIAQNFYWKFTKKDTNEFRRELGLPELKENLINYLDRQKILDLYCISPSLIHQPKDWESHHKITGFILSNTLPQKPIQDNTIYTNIEKWLNKGQAPIYVGFGSNGVGNPEKVATIINDILNHTNERILFCGGWSQISNLKPHRNLFVAKYVDHQSVLPKCKIGIFHGGAGTLATMLQHQLPVIIVSFYTDQPAWGKIIEKKQLGMHIPFKKLNSSNIISAIKKVQSDEIKKKVKAISENIINENGLNNTVDKLQNYFKSTN